jgi:hypothetical protein
MSAGFGELLSVLLRNQGYTQQGLCEWLLVNQHLPKRFNTVYSIKERFRMARASELPAQYFPLVFDVARFFESKGKLDTAARIRHIYLQQSYDTGNFNRLFADATPHSESISWMIFPEVDRSTLVGHYRQWRSHTFNGDRTLVRESLDFFHQYSRSYIHSPIRQMIAVELSRVAITHGEYVEAYMIATAFTTKWEAYIKTPSHLKPTYRPVIGDVYNYLTALQIRATAASHIFDYAPFAASVRLFTQALYRLREQKRLLSRYETISRALLIQWHVRFLRMLCRAHMTLAESDAVRSKIDSTLLGHLRRLKRLLDQDDSWTENEFIEPFLVFDTVARCIALSACSMDSLEEASLVAQESLRWIKKSDGAQGGPVPNVLRNYRRASTEAIFEISKYRLTRTTGAHANAGEAIKRLLEVVPAVQSYHTRLTVKCLSTYLMQCQLGPEGVFIRDCTERPIESELRKLDMKADKESGLMFAVNMDDSEHLACLIQANLFKSSQELLEEFIRGSES